MPHIIPEVEAFKIAYEAERAASAITRDYELDKRIAERAGDPTEDIEKAKSEHVTNVWYPAYQQRAKATTAMFEALGLDPEIVKRVML